LTPLILSIDVKQLANFYFPALESGRGAIITILFHMRELVFHPFKILRWAAAFFVAFGPFLIATLFDLSKRRYYDNRRNLLIIFSVLYALFGIFIGGDMTRIIYLGFPFIMTLIIFELKEISNKEFWILVFLSLPLMFLMNTIPNPAFEWEAWQAWYPEFAPINTVLLFVGYTLICALIIRTLRLKSN
jgi:pilus assembly protein TadC